MQQLLCCEEKPGFWPKGQSRGLSAALGHHHLYVNAHNERGGVVREVAKSFVGVLSCNAHNEKGGRGGGVASYNDKGGRDEGVWLRALED